MALRVTECRKSEIINWGTFVAKVSLATIAYIQLKALLKQQMPIFTKIRPGFFDNETNRKIIVAIEEQRKVPKENNGDFTDYELDDHLGYYELMSWYKKESWILK